MPLSHDDVLRLATLARLRMSPAETADVLAPLNRVLALVGDLQAADTAGIEPMSHPAASAEGAELRLREDRVIETDRRSLYQAVAPKVEQGLYLVPQVIE
jgi:aspartyl-tRNA(Asn)/glutamyl-tRNA(Gln) amidotransferase subunit C